MNTCYGCVDQKNYPSTVRCHNCSDEGSAYTVRPDFSQWHKANCTPKAESAEKSDNTDSQKLPKDIREKFSKFVNNQVALPKGFAAIVNDNFWDLL